MLFVTIFHHEDLQKNIFYAFDLFKYKLFNDNFIQSLTLSQHLKQTPKTYKYCPTKQNQNILNFNIFLLGFG